MNEPAGSDIDDQHKALSRTAVIIPAQNEERSLGLVLNDLPDVAFVILVDNGSTDRTGDIARQSGCIVVEEPIAGYGRACLAGIAKLRSMQGTVTSDATKSGATDSGTTDSGATDSDATNSGTVQTDAAHTKVQYVAFLDADYSDHPEELLRLLSVLEESDADFVLGSRMSGQREQGAMPLQAVLGNWLACTLMKLIWRTDYTDLGPFRVIDYDSLMRLGMQDLNFGWTIEMQIKAKLAGLKTIEIPVSYRRRVGVSKISGTISGTFRAGYKILYTIAKYSLQRNTFRPKAE